MKTSYAEIERIAVPDCSCSPRQQTGDDPTVCFSCTAGGMLNMLGEMSGDMLQELETMGALKEAVEG